MDWDDNEKPRKEVTRPDTGADYIIRPNFINKFRPAQLKPIIHSVLQEVLTDGVYNAAQVPEWTTTIAKEIRTRLKTTECGRHKFLVQVVIGEQRGEGVKLACRCLWDSDTDAYVEDVFMNDSLFCVALVFGIFYY